MAKRPTLKTAVILSDLHIPYLDKTAYSIARQITKDLKPDVFVLAGDVLDCVTLSTFDKEISRLSYLQDELDQGIAILKDLASITPQSSRIFLEGNHEARLGKAINRMSDDAREIARLNVFQEVMNWPSLLKLGTAWQFVPTNKQPLKGIIPHTVLTHGNIVRAASGYSAKGQLDKVGASGVSGHVHRLGIHHSTNITGNRIWLENGCLCSLVPDYMNSPNWQQGFSIATWIGNEQPHWEQVHINDGKTIFRGTTYTGTTK